MFYKSQISKSELTNFNNHNMKQTITKQILKLAFVLSLLIIVNNAMAQNRITGTITDNSNDPIPGVTVLVKGESNGTISDIDGNFSISEVNPKSVLQFSFVGMATQEVTVGNNSKLTIVMEALDINLSEIVAVGYGVQKRTNLTGSVGQVKQEDLLERPVANTTELLQGQVAGLQTRQSSGLPGADGATLNIRGYGNNPLVLVDGIEARLAEIDPNDIESISVLKDASAAIYGARAGNGVILINTKKGKQGKTSITYHGNMSFTAPTFLPEHVSAANWAEMITEQGLDPLLQSPQYVQYDPETKKLINTVDGSEYMGYNWSKEIYKNYAPQQTHNISATGGNDRVNFFMSAGFVDQESNFKSGDYDFSRYNVRSNVDAKISKNLKVSLNLNYRAQVLDKANFDVEDMYNSLQTAKPVFPAVHEQDPTRASWSGFVQRSPYYQTIKDYSGSRNDARNTFFGSMEIAYSMPFIKGLEASAKLMYEEINILNKKISKPFEVWDYDPTDYDNDKEVWELAGIQGKNTMSLDYNKIIELMPVFSLTYVNSFGNHNINALLVSETRQFSDHKLGAERKDLLSFEAPYLDYASKEEMNNSESFSQRARSSVIGRVNYDYAGKYLFEFSLRADASAEYPPEGRWGYFPSISAGWRVSEEAFMKSNFPELNNLKIRGSYGILGNDAVSNFDYLTGYNITDKSYIFGNTPHPIIESAGLANADITWEQMTMSNVGIDGMWYNGLIGFELDGFYRLREGILTNANKTVPNTFGASLPKTNLNKRDNRGFELVLTHKNKIGNISYHFNPMVSWTRGKIVEQQEVLKPIIGDDLTPEQVEDNILWNNRNSKEGQWDDRFWGYQFDGIFESQEDIDNYTNKHSDITTAALKVGDFKYKDVNGDSIINWKDEIVLGKNGLPNWTFGARAGFKYKNLSVNMLLQGGAGYTVTFAGSAASPFGNENVPLTEHYTYRAIVGEDAEGNSIITNTDTYKLPPVINAGGLTANNNVTSDFWSYNAMFLRLKSLNVSYDMPKPWLKKAGISNISIYFSGTNLLTFSNLGIWKDSFDPEITNQNNKDYPPVKVLTFGTRLTF